MDTDLIVGMRQVSFAYGAGRPVLQQADLELRRGQKIGLVGYNGSGKTTLLHLVMGLVQGMTGELTLFGKAMRREPDFLPMRQRIGLLFQDADDQLFCPSVLEDVAFGPLNQGKSPEEARQIAVTALAELGLSGFEDRLTHELSGGEKKLVSLATVLAMQPEALLLDEPTNGLDEATRRTIIDVLQRGTFTVLAISHDYDFLEHIATRIVSLENGRLITEEGVAVHSHIHLHRFGDYPHEHSS